MNPRITLAVAARVLTQLRRDHRTAGDAAGAAVPADLAAVVDVRGHRRRPFDRFGPALLAMFPFIVMFLVTSVTTLRERSSGTLERLLAMPMGKLDFLLGYALAFGLVAARPVGARRRASASGCSASTSPGPVWLLGAGGGGRRRARHRARPVRQRVRAHRVPGRPVHAADRVPADPAVRPVRAARRRCPTCCDAVSDVLPLSYAVDAMQHLTAQHRRPATSGSDLAVVAAFAVGGAGAGGGHPAAAYALIRTRGSDVA